MVFYLYQIKLKWRGAERIGEEKRGQTEGRKIIAEEKEKNDLETI